MTRRNDAPVATMGWGLPRPSLPLETMRERLAVAALCGWNNVPADNPAMLAEWKKRCEEPGNQPTRRAWERVVDAILTELESPTCGMLRNAAKAMSPARRPTEQWVSARMKHRIRYQAMIKAIKDGK